MKYFKHDSDAAQDAKLRRLRMKYGMEGYGVYWFILELIARNVEQHNLTFELEHDAELIAVDTGIHHERVQEMMRAMVDLGLFENVNGIITCLKMASRTDEYTQKLIAKAKKSGTVLRLSGHTPDSVGTKSVLIKEKKTKESNSRFAPPTPDEVSAYALSAGLPVDGNRFVDFYASKGWKVGKNQMKDWQAAVRTWGRNTDNRSGQGAAPSVVKEWSI